MFSEYYTYKELARFTLFFSSPNVAACFIGIISTVLVCTLVRCKLKMAASAVIIAGIATLNVLLLLTMSRGGIVAYVVATGVLLLHKTYRRRVALILSLLLFAACFFPQAASRFAHSTRDRSTINRIELWSNICYMANTESIFGVGKHAFNDTYTSWYQPLNNSETYRTGVSNAFTILGYFGYVGFLLYTSLSVAVLSACYIASRRDWLCFVATNVQLVFHINGVFSYFVDIAIISFPVFAMAALGFIRAATIIQTGEVFVVKTALAISCAIPVLGCAAIGIIGSNVGALSQSVVRSPRIEERLLVPYKDTSTVEIVFVANRNEAFNFARSPIRRLAEDYTVRALFEDRLFFNRVTPVERDVGDVEAVVVFAGSASVSLVSEMKQNAVIGVLTDRSYVIVPRNIISMKNLVALSSQCSSKVVFFVEDVNRSVFAVNAGVAVLLSSPVKSPAEFHDICATWIARKLRSRLI